MPIRVLKKRLNKYGTDFEVKRHRQNNIKILIKAKKLNDKRVNELILNQGKLEFWELYRGDAFFPFVMELNNSLIDEKENDSIKINPLLDLIASQGYQGGPVVFQTKKEDTATINSFLNRKEAKFYLPSEYNHVKFLWGIPDSNNHIPLYVAKSNREKTPPLTGNSITDAFQNYDAINRPTVSINMDKEGALIWERITGSAFRNATSIAITINNTVYSAPGVTVGAIKGGKSEISGNFTLKEAQDLAIVLSSQESIPKLKLLEYSKLKN